MFDLIANGMGRIFAWLERLTGVGEDEMILCFLLSILAPAVLLHTPKKNCWIQEHPGQMSTIECVK